MKITKEDLRKIVKEELQSTLLKEAEEVDFNQLLPQQQKQVQAFEKVLGGKHSQIWDGIHGKIVDIKTQSYYGNYRFDIDTMKKLVALKARWVEADGQRVSVGF